MRPRRIDISIAWRAALAQGAGVAALFAALALTLPRSIFEDWGWAIGPAAWAACALLTALVLGLGVPRVLIAAALAGIPSAVAVLAGQHTLSPILGVVAFGPLCGALAADARRPAA